MLSERGFGRIKLILRMSLKEPDPSIAFADFVQQLKAKLE